MDKNNVLAVVGNREITQKDVDTILRSLNPQTAMQFQSEEGMKKLVEELVNQELFYLDALEQGLDSDNEYVREVEKAKANILKQFALSRLLNDAVVSESEIVNHYVANQSRFAAAPSVKASHILVYSREKAEQIAEEIQGGLSFEEAAEKYSSCPSRERGGDLGYFSDGMMVPEFEKAAFAMEKGEISAPIKTQFGYHLIKVFDKKQADVKSLDEVRNELANQLLAKKQQEIYLHRVNELKGKYAIRINI